MMLFTCMTAMLWAVLLNSNKCKNVQQHDKATVHNTCSRLQETIYSLGNMCVFLFFTHQAIDVLFLQCQFAPPNPTLLLPSWLLSNGPRDLIGLGCAFGHTDCDSQLVNEFSLFAHYTERTQADFFLGSYLPFKTNLWSKTLQKHKTKKTTALSVD